MLTKIPNVGDILWLPSSTLVFKGLFSAAAAETNVQVISNPVVVLCTGLSEDKKWCYIKIPGSDERFRVDIKYLWDLLNVDLKSYNLHLVKRKGQ